MQLPAVTHTLSHTVSMCFYVYLLLLSSLSLFLLSLVSLCVCVYVSSSLLLRPPSFLLLGKGAASSSWRHASHNAVKTRPPGLRQPCSGERRPARRAEERGISQSLSAARIAMHGTSRGQTGHRRILHRSENCFLQVGIPWQRLRQVQILSHLQAGHLVCHVNARLSTVTALQYLVNSRLMRFRLPLPTPPHTPERARPQPSTCRRLEVKCRVDFSSLSRSLSLARALCLSLSTCRRLQVECWLLQVERRLLDGTA